MIRIATFNIGLARLHKLGLTLFEAVPWQRQRLPAIRDRLAADRDGIDIWLLQEAYGPAVVRMLAATPGYRPASALEMGADLGLMILVRRGVAISDTQVTLFPPVDWSEKYIARKGVMSVDIRTPDGPLRIGNLHMSYNGRSAASAAGAPALRARQSDFAVDHMESDGAAGRLLLLGGDFNASAAHEPETWRVPVDRGWTDCRQAAGDAFDSHGVCSWDLSNPATRGHGRNEDIDQIYMVDARNGLHPQDPPPQPAIRARHFLHEPVVNVPDDDVERSPLSDHNGLAVEIDLAP